MNENVQNLNTTVYTQLDTVLRFLELAQFKMKGITPGRWTEHPLVKDIEVHITLAIANTKVSMRQISDEQEKK